MQGIVIFKPVVLNLLISLYVQVDRYRESYPGLRKLKQDESNSTQDHPEAPEPPTLVSSNLVPEQTLGTSSLNRPKRDVESEFLSELNWGSTKCTFVSCLVGPLGKREYTLIKLRSRLWVRTLDSIHRNDVEISSKLVTRVTKLPYGVDPAYLGYKTHHVTTQVRNVFVSVKQNQ